MSPQKIPIPAVCDSAIPVFHWQRRLSYTVVWSVRSTLYFSEKCVETSDENLVNFCRDCWIRVIFYNFFTTFESGSDQNLFYFLYLVVELVWIAEKNSLCVFFKHNVFVWRFVVRTCCLGNRKEKLKWFTGLFYLLHFILYFFYEVYKFSHEYCVTAHSCFALVFCAKGRRPCIIDPFLA